jgi:cyclic-di-GMP-binding protein
MATTNPIGLRVPEQAPPKGVPFYLNDKDVATWAGNLPMANIGETSRQIFQTLRTFNRTEAPARQRLMSLESFRQPLAYVATNLNKHYIGSRFPLSEKSHKIANLNRELHSGMATGYKSVIVDLLTTQHGETLDLTLLKQAIHRGINYLSRVILLSVLVYDPYPKRSWQELHVLHRLARRYEVIDQPVADELETFTKQSSIAANYCRCLLFSLASPYKMRQNENLKIFDSLLEWSRFASFFPFNEAPEDASIIIRQDTDLAPGHEQRVTDPDTKYLQVLDASRLLSELREQFNETPENQTSLPGLSELDKGVIRQLIMLWSKAQKRAFVRTKLNFELRIAVGLKSVYKLINLGDIPSSARTEKEPEEGTWIETQFAHGHDMHVSSRFSLQPLDIASYNPRRSNFEEFGPRSTEYSEFSEEPSMDIWHDDKDQTIDKATNLFNTINESAGGYCLDWRGKQIPKIQVGELIGVQSAMSASKFGVGMVRWMRSADTESMQVGIQMIAPNALAITARLADQQNQKMEKCLLLPEVGTSGQPTSLLCPSYPFTLGKKLLINDGENSQEIKLTRLLESTGSISQFQFVRLDEKTKTPPTEDQNDIDDDSDYESLWSTLI